MSDSFQCAAVLFDMDGVLLDTEPLYTVAYDRILRPYGATLDPVTKLEIMGRQAIKSAAHVIEKFGLPLSPEEFLERRKPILDELFADPPAVPGAEQLVRAVSEAGVALAVATSTSRPLFEKKTVNHPWFSLFDEIVCGDDPEVKNPKPAPDIFQTAARRLRVPTERCVVFEDSPSGVQAAVASGARTIALVRGELDRDRYEGAFRVMKSLAEGTSFVLSVS